MTDSALSIATSPLSREVILAEFSRNLPRHISGVAQALNERLMAQCVAAGHAGLRAAFNPVLTRLTKSGIRIVDIANSCHITQQAAGQLVGELEKLGYIKRKPDDDDKRAKQLMLTGKGERLLDDCARLAGDVQRELADVIGAAPLATLETNCAKLYKSLVPHPSAVGDDKTHKINQAERIDKNKKNERNEKSEKNDKPYKLNSLALSLTGLATYCEAELMELDKLKGHLRLKMSFSQVISHISPHGSLINELAKINGVSKQAISQVVKEVEEIGYIARQQNPHDARSTKLFLTDYGLQLIADSVANISVLRAQMTEILGARALQQMAVQIENLYDYFSSATAQLLDESQRSHCENALHRTVDALYRTGSVEQQLLFVRSGNRVRLSPLALDMLARMDIKIAKH